MDVRLAAREDERMAPWTDACTDLQTKLLSDNVKSRVVHRSLKVLMEIVGNTFFFYQL